MKTQNKFILVYHGIGTNNLFMEVAENLFKQQIEYLLFKGFTFCTLNDLFSTSEPSVSITFDDGLASMKKVGDFLDSMRIPFGLSIIASSLIDNQAKYLPPEDLRRFEHAEFYSHGLKHVDLTKVSKSELREELLVSRRLLQEKLRKGIDSFVYPFGKYNDQIVQEVKGAGYRNALGLLPFHIDNKSNMYLLPRVNINGAVTMKKFKLLTSALGNVYLYGAFFKRKLLGQNYLSQ